MVLGRLLDRLSTRQEVPELAVVGLGNPGREYADTLHNVGFRCVDLIADRHGTRLQASSKRFLSEVVTIGVKAVALTKPLTFVNKSGLAVREIASKYNLEPSSILVVYDDMDLDPGVLRLRPKGGSGGHNGIKSIIDCLSTQEFPRVRVGVGRPRSGGAVKHVLGRASKLDAEIIDESIERAADAVTVVVTEGVEAAMNRFNRG